MILRRLPLLAIAAMAVATMLVALPARAKEATPNILVIWGDDIGQSNISAYTRGLIGKIPPAEAEARYYTMLKQPAMTA